MQAVCMHTHWVPLYWRRRAHTLEVRDEFQSLYQYQLVLFLEEVVSVLALPWLCGVSLPRSSGDIALFLQRVCSPQ
jgi:autophagy-related protein 9